MTKIKTLFLILLATSACSKENLKNNLGLGRHSPDEFMILTNDPLSIPDSDKLPEPGSVKTVATNKISPQEQAKLALSGNDEVAKKDASEKITSAEQLFLKQIKEGDTDIHNKITADNEGVSKNFITGTVTVDVVDSKKEAERIDVIIEEGKSLTGEGAITAKAKEKVN